MASKEKVYSITKKGVEELAERLLVADYVFKQILTKDIKEKRRQNYERCN